MYEVILNNKFGSVYNFSNTAIESSKIKEWFLFKAIENKDLKVIKID